MTYHPLSFEIFKRFFPEGRRLDSLFRQVFKEKRVNPKEKRIIYYEVTGFIRLFPAWMAVNEPGKPVDEAEWTTILKAIKDFDWEAHAEKLINLPNKTRITPALLSEFGLPVLFRSWIGETVPDSQVLNFLKKSVMTRPVYLREIQDQVQVDPDLEPVYGIPGAWKLNNPILDFADDWFQSGQFEIQDLSGQIASLLVNPKPNEKVMDACAGHGGKTIALAGLMKGKGKIVTVHVSDAEMQTLKLRARKHGIGNISPVKLDSPALDALKGTMDIVWVDAPCTGSGVIRRNPEVIYRLSETVIKKMEEEQLILLNHYAQFVKPGGKLVYSTCSVFQNENEGVIQDFKSEHGAEMSLGSFSQGLNYYHLALPDLNPIRLGFADEPDSDGFFLAVFSRKK